MKLSNFSDEKGLFEQLFILVRKVVGIVLLNPPPGVSESPRVLRHGCFD